MAQWSGGKQHWREGISVWGGSELDLKYLTHTAYPSVINQAMVILKKAVYSSTQEMIIIYPFALDQLLVMP